MTLRVSLPIWIRSAFSCFGVAERSRFLRCADLEREREECERERFSDERRLARAPSASFSALRRVRSLDFGRSFAGFAAARGLALLLRERECAARLLSRLL